MSVCGYPAVTVFCCLFRVVLGLCVGVSLSLRFFSVISPSVWCLLVVTNGHASSDWSLGPVLVNVCLGVYIYASWLGRFWSLFLVPFCFYIFDKGGLIVFITTLMSTGSLDSTYVECSVHSVTEHLDLACHR